MEVSRTQLVLLSLSLLIQSSVGSAMAIILWTLRQKMIMIIGEHNEVVLIYFTVTSLIINIIMFIISFIIISVQFANNIVRSSQERVRRNRRHHQVGGVYGAFGYFSVVQY